MRQSLLLIFLVLFVSFSFAQKGIIGKWKTIDDETGKAVSVVEIFENHGKIYGKVVEVINPKDRVNYC
jgi:hypothetical protein